MSDKFYEELEKKKEVQLKNSKQKLIAERNLYIGIVIGIVILFIINMIGGWI